MPPRSDASTESRDCIIQAALACFTRKGYNNTTMDDIVAESGLSKGSLYWHFESKQGLFEAALLSVFEGFGQDVLSMLAHCETASDKLRFMGQGAADFSESVVGYFSLFLEFWVSSEHREKSGQIWYDLLEEYNGLMVTIIEEGIQNGEFEPVDAESLVWALLAAYDGLAAYAAFVPNIDLGQISQTFVDVILNGLKFDSGEA